jgi:hypothetical protein
MRNGQKRMRGRSNNNNNNNNNNNSHRKSQNPLTRVYESNGPDVKIRGTASHIAEKYMQLARDSQSSGDPVAAENYFQHAEHYFRLIATAQEQLRQQNPYYNNPAPTPGAPTGAADDNYDDSDDDVQPFVAQNDPNFQPQPPQAQPYLPRDAQPFPPRDQPQHSRPQHGRQQHQPQPVVTSGDGAADIGGLPAFITGGGQQPSLPMGEPNGNQAGPNGHEQSDRPDRFGRRRRRHRSPAGFRGDGNGNGPSEDVGNGGGGGDEPQQQQPE